jgi:hypothetical protein
MSRAQLLAAGLSPEAIGRRIRNRRLIKPHPIDWPQYRLAVEVDVYSRAWAGSRRR